MRYAAYGSNLHPLRLGKRTPSARLLGTAPLHGWELTFHKRSRDGSGKCTIAPGGDGVHVAIYEIDSADKQELDRIEGLGCGYDETRLSVPEFGSCATYVAQDSYLDASLPVYDWYRELVLLGARFHNFPITYVNLIEELEAISDPNEDRHLRNWTLAKAILSNSGIE